MFKQQARAMAVTLKEMNKQFAISLIGRLGTHPDIKINPKWIKEFEKDNT